MRTFIIALFTLTAFPSISARAESQGATTGTKTQQGQAEFKIMHVEELASLLSANDPKLSIFDANSPDTREKQGIIPGAKPLSSFKSYDVGKELPAAKDAKLVFYCADTR